MTTSDGYVADGMQLNIPYSFPSGTVVVRGRGRHMHESWHLLENEVDDAWNHWVLLTREEPVGYWVIQKIVPWWGYWNGTYEERAPPAPSAQPRSCPSIN